MRVDGYLVMKVEDYEYGVQYLASNFDPPEWKMSWSNKHETGWYANEKCAKNALAQLRAPSYGRPSLYEYRLVRRPVGAVEIVNG